MSNFVHLHVHSEYSLLDGLSSVKSIAERASELGQSAIALTDHGVMFGAIEFYQACRRANIKPIIGMEAYLARRSRTERNPQLHGDSYHLLLLAENDEGYHNLLRLATAAQLEGFYRYPRIDKELLAQHSAGLICTSGCLAAEIPELLRAQRVNEAHAALDWYRDVFPNRFYLELQQHEGLRELEPINRQLIEWSSELELPLIATCDAHYTRAQDAEAHDILLCVQTGKTLDDPKRLRMTSRDYYLRSTEEMRALWNEVPRAITNTLEIAERCSMNLDFNGYYLPRFDSPDGFTPETYLRALCHEGIGRRYDTITDAVQKRADYELAVIHQMGFDTYFLIVWDLIRYARENHIWFNVRGSASSSVVAYALGITSIEPLSNHLLFERFLNPDRISMPDIDLDFSDDERARMLNYVVTRYGKENVAQIVTFGRMLAKAAVRDVGRVLEYPIPEVNRIAKLIPNLPGQTLSDALDQSSELKSLYASDARAQKLIDSARPLEGVTRNVSTHPAGVILADKPIVEYAPLHRATSGSVPSTVSQVETNAQGVVPITQYAMNDLEQIGLLKIDLLGLKTLRVMRNVCAVVQQRHRITFDLASIPLDDTEAFTLLACGDVMGIFQVESQGLRDVLTQMKPNRFEHIVAAIALYRPGPLQYIPTYIKRMHGDEPVTFLHPSLEPILGETYGIIVFQESIMQIARDCCGFTGGEADTLRKAVGKKKKDELLAQREKFVHGAIAHAGMSQEIGNKLFDDIEYFARYAFNRAHAMNYAALTLQTAYLKAHYLLEYMWALWNSEAGDLEKMALLASEARRAGIEILPPDVRYSDVEFSLESERRALRYGIGAIKNVGECAAQIIVNARREGGVFTSLADFCQRVPLKQINRRALESLISAGALDALGERAALLKSVERLIGASKAAAVTNEKGQLSFFENAPTEFLGVELATTAPMSSSEKAKLERELLGIAFSENVVERLRAVLRERQMHVLSSAAIADANEKNGLLTTAGIIKNVRKTKTKKGEPMAFVQIEDEEGDTEFVLFPRAYANAASLLHKDNAVLVEGRIQTRDDKNSFIVERVQAVLNDDAGIMNEMNSVTGNAVADALLNSHSQAQSSSSLLHRVGEARTEKTIVTTQTLPSAPPLRRAASVFGTRGSEIVTRRSSIPVRVEEHGNDELETPNEVLDEEKSSDVQDAERRRIYVHFRELPPEEAAEYVRPLFDLFNAHRGDDEVALLFERSDGPIKIGAPNGVEYDAISSRVVEMIGKDAIVEIL